MTFLGETVRFGETWDWQAGFMPLLWRFHLHYFDFLHLLGTEERWELCREWIEHNPPARGVGWHPYPTSLRVANWCKLLDGAAPAPVRESLYRQAGFLARNLETYLTGNHLLANARALVLAGLCFGERGEAPDWVSKGLAMYREQLPEQVLPDGGHYERSPLYHSDVLVGCLDVLNVLAAGHPDRRLLEETADRMTAFLRGVCHPDGGVSLLNDCTLDGAEPPERVLAYAGRMGVPPPRRRPAESDGLRAFPDSGVYSCRMGPLALVLDAGPIGPTHLPAHGHADAFTFEMSVRGTRMITDTGVYDYRPGEMRDYCRSTRAHNTVEVDGVDQAEVWGGFRVGRSYEPTVRESRLRDGSWRFHGTFEGYAHLVGDGIVHERRVLCDGRGGRLRVEDRVDGRGEHEVASRIHLHPEVSVDRVPRGLRLRRGDAALLLRTSHEPDVERGWYCPRFGVRRRRPVVRLGGRTALPGVWEYELTVE